MSLAPLFMPWSENRLATSPSVTIVGANALALFPVANLYDGDPAMVCKLDATTALILCDFGSAVHVPWMCGINHNLTAALAVSWRGYTSSPATLGTSPQVTVPVTIGALEADGYRPNFWVDVDAVDNAASYRYWGLAITGTNAANIILGELLVATVRTTLPRWFKLEDVDVDVIDSIENLTYGESSFRAESGFRRVILSGQLLAADRTERDAVRDYFRALRGRSRPLVVVPAPERPLVLMGVFDQTNLPWTSTDGVYEAPVTFRELSRGLTL